MAEFLSNINNNNNQVQNECDIAIFEKIDTNDCADQAPFPSSALVEEIRNTPVVYIAPVPIEDINSKKRKKRGGKTAENGGHYRNKLMPNISRMRDFTQEEMERFPQLTSMSKEQVRNNIVLWKEIKKFNNSQA